MTDRDQRELARLQRMEEDLIRQRMAKSDERRSLWLAAAIFAFFALLHYLFPGRQ